MERKKTIGIALIAGGIILLILSLLADVLGVGGNLAVFGWKQILGAVVGVVVAVAGAVLLRRK